MPRHFGLLILAAFCSTSIARPLKPSVVYGNDDRLEAYQIEDLGLRALTDSTVAIIPFGLVTEVDGRFHIGGNIYGPEYGLCEREPYYSQPDPANCSGFYLGGDLIATAGHCISMSDCSTWKIAFGFRMNDASTVSADHGPEDIYNCAEVLGAQEGYPIDWAVIRLDREVVGHAPVKLAASAPSVGDKLMVIGHPSGLPVKVAGGASVRALQDGYFEANLDTYHGNSGSAVFNETTREVAGILVRGEEDYAYDSANSCYISNVCANDGCSGESVTYISYVIEKLKELGKYN